MNKYWETFSINEGATFNSNSDRITVGSTPVVKNYYKLNWNKKKINYEITSWSNDHSQSHMNSYFTEFKLSFNIKTDIEFEFEKLNILEKIYFRLRKRIGKKVVENILITSNDFKQSKNILNFIKKGNIYFEKVKLSKLESHIELYLSTRQDIQFEGNANEYIEILSEIMNRINNT